MSARWSSWFIVLNIDRLIPAGLLVDEVSKIPVNLE